MSVSIENIKMPTSTMLSTINYQLLICRLKTVNTKIILVKISSIRFSRLYGFHVATSSLYVHYLFWKVFLIVFFTLIEIPDIDFITTKKLKKSCKVYSVNSWNAIDWKTFFANNLLWPFYYVLNELSFGFFYGSDEFLTKIDNKN